MSRAKELVGDYLKTIDAVQAQWARKTVFTNQDDGSMHRKIVRRDGTIEKDEIIPAERIELANARAKSGLSQSQFAHRLGVSRRTLQEWEQGRKKPSGPARVLLKMVSNHPELLREPA